MGFVVVVLALMLSGQWLIIWRLLDKLLAKNNILPLGPVIQTGSEKIEKLETRKKLFSVRVDE